MLIQNSSLRVIEVSAVFELSNLLPVTDVGLVIILNRSFIICYRGGVLFTLFELTNPLPATKMMVVFALDCSLYGFYG